MEGKSSKEVVSEYIDNVKNLIELSMQQYMTPQEIVNKLQNEENVKPEITKIMLQRLEKENPEFFEGYYTRVALKHQIEEFNRLLEKQKQLMDEEKNKVAVMDPTNEAQLDEPMGKGKRTKTRPIKLQDFNLSKPK